MSTSRIGVPPSALPAPIRRGARTRPAASLLAVSGLVVSLAILPATAQAARHRAPSPGARSAVIARSSDPATPASAFCAHFSAKTVSSLVGANEVLLEVLDETSYECIFMGTTAAGWQVIISMRQGMPASELATLKAAEARITAQSPKDVTLVFTPLPTLSKTAFSWTYAKPLNGGQLVGVANNTKTTGYGAAMGRAAATFGKAAAHVPVLERLLALDMAA